MLKILAAATAAGLAATAFVLAPTVDGQAAGACGGWTASTVASGLGSLENLAPDGTGGFFLSATDKKAIEDLHPDGSVSTVVANVETPGGLVVSGRTLYFVTGDSLVNAAFNLAGTVDAVDLGTGARRTVAKAAAPNGLALLPDGRLAVSTLTFVNTTGITAVDPRTGVATKKWSAQPYTDGLFADGTTLFTDQSYAGQLLAIPLAGSPTVPGTPRVVATPGTVLDGYDDLTIGPDGALYAAANFGGHLDRVDLATGAVCTVAANLGNPSSIRVWNGALYVTGFDGTVKRFSR